MITLAIAIPLAVASVAGPVELPSAWAGDIGAPVAYGDETVYVYGDIIVNDLFVQGVNILAPDGTVLTDVIPTPDPDVWYWPTDGITMADGRFVLLASEIHPTGDGIWDFDSRDTDAFVLSDPTDPQSWKYAQRVEDGSWADLHVEFSDQEPLAFTRADRSFHTDLWTYPEGDPLAEWTQVEADLPDSYSTFVPINVGDRWIGLVQTDERTVETWGAPAAPGPWTPTGEVQTFPADTYNHALNVIDGQVWHRYSTLNGRVTYQEVNL